MNEHTALGSTSADNVHWLSSSHIKCYHRWRVHKTVCDNWLKKNSLRYEPALHNTQYTQLKPVISWLWPHINITNAIHLQQHSNFLAPKCFNPFAAYRDTFTKALVAVCHVWHVCTSHTELLSAFNGLTLLVGQQEGHLSCKNWVVRYWHGYLSAARRKWFAHGPADATANHHLLLHLNQE